MSSNISKKAKTRTISVSATELTDVNVGYISLVKRGANQVPFRIVKKDKDDTQIKEKNMIVLGDLFTKILKKDSEPKMTAIIVKAESAASIEPQLIAAGYNVTDKVEEDGAVMYKQGGFDDAETDVTVFKVNDDIACAVTHVEKSFSLYKDGLSFIEKTASQGFMPSVGVGVDALRDSMFDSLYDSTDKDTAVTEIAKNLEEFSTYVNTLAGNLPDAVFKMDKIVAKADASATPAPTDTKDEASTQDLTDTKVVDKAGDKDNASCAAGESMVDGVCVKPAKAKKEDTTNSGEGGAVEDVKGDSVQKVLESLTALTEVVTVINSRVEKADSDNKAAMTLLGDRITEVATVAKRAKDALEGTTGSSANEDNLAANTKKSDPEDSLWDGALEFND